MPDLLTQVQFAELVGCSQATVSRAIHRGRLLLYADREYGCRRIDPDCDHSIVFALKQNVRRLRAGLPPSPWALASEQESALEERPGDRADETALSLGRRVAALPPVEREIVETLLSRLEKGCVDFGPWPSPDEERRDLELEAIEEAIDGFAYSAAALLKVRLEHEP